jgi:uncharacterized protein YpmS
MKNKWKKAFLILLGLNLLILIVIFSLLLTPTGSKQSSKQNVQSGDSVSFNVKSNKNDLNMLINHYLKKEAADSPIAYQVVLGDEVELYGTLPLFSEKINMKLTFEPDALSNGDLVLKQKSINVGSLPLPVSYVLKFISETYKLPQGVDIRPDDKLVYINMQQLKLNSDIKIKVDQFDLKNDNIVFTLLVPIK